MIAHNEGRLWESNIFAKGMMSDWLRCTIKMGYCSVASDERLASAMLLKIVLVCNFLMTVHKQINCPLPTIPEPAYCEILQCVDEHPFAAPGPFDKLVV